MQQTIDTGSSYYPIWICTAPHFYTSEGKFLNNSCQQDKVMHCYSGISSQTVSFFFPPPQKIGPFLGDACPQAPTWHEVKRSSDIRSCKWAMAADGTLIALLFAAVCVPLCGSQEHKNKAVSQPSVKIICDPHNYVGQGVWIIKEDRLQ